VLTGVVDRDDVGVVEGARCLRLVLEALEPVLVLGEVVMHDLERHLAREPLVARAVDLAHPALAEESEHLVRPDPDAGGEAGQGGHDGFPGRESSSA
jgi:hypothetical protein